MAPVPRSAVCTLYLFIVGFSVLLQLNIVLFYLNVIVYKYKRKRMLLLLRRRLELCRKIYLYRIKKEKPDKNQDFGYDQAEAINCGKILSTDLCFLQNYTKIFVCQRIVLRNYAANFRLT